METLRKQFNEHRTLTWIVGVFLWMVTLTEGVAIYYIEKRVDVIARSQVTVDLHFSKPEQVAPTMEALHRGLPGLR